MEMECPYVKDRNLYKEKKQEAAEEENIYVRICGIYWSG